MNFNIKLEKFNREDFSYYFELVNDAKVMAMITECAIEVDEATKDFDAIIENNKIHKDFGSFKIIDAATDAFLGFAKLEVKSIDAHEAELGYMILPQYWGRGLAGQVAKHLIESAKEKKQIKKLFAIIDPSNLPSRKILINNGFESIRFEDLDGLPGEILEKSI